MKFILSIMLSVLMFFNGAFMNVSALTTVKSNQKYSTVSTQDINNSNAKSPKIDVAVTTGEEEDKISEQQYADDEIVRVSIVLESDATLVKYSADDIATNKKAKAYRATLAKEQSKITSKIEKALGESLEVKRNLTLAANIISAEVTYGEIEEILKISGVKEVWIEQQYAAEDDVNTSVTTSEMVHATAAWTDGYTGAGQLVAIVDTGTDQDHVSFSGAALEYALTKDGKSLSDYDLLTKEDIAKVADQLNAEIDVDKVYESTKIPYAYNYIDENYNTDHLSDTAEEHGSHVSGIAAANRYVEVDGEYVDAATTAYAVGVAPDAQIITMKVFGKGGGAYDSDYFAAIEDAIVLGADSVNLSLGSGNPGSSFSAGYQNIMDSLVESYTVVVMSAGNSSNYTASAENDTYGGYLYSDDIAYQTDGTPGSFINTLAVASADNIGMTGMPLVFNGSQSVFYTETSGYGNSPMSSIAGEYEYVYVDSAGEAADFEAVDAEIDLEGKIVICNRGAISFYVKANNAAAYNAAGVVVANNQAGSISMNLTGLTATFPVVSITLAEAKEIKANSTATTVGSYNVYTGTVTITDQISSSVAADRSEATMSSFSSWGIPGSLTLKPEITAPGGSIYSVKGAYVSKDDGTTQGGDHASYELMSGTSMAAPQVTGMSAVLAQYIEENDLAQYTNGNQRTLINSLLMSTATPMLDEYGYYYSILQQGAGLADVYAATKALSFIMMGEDATASYADGKVKAELGDDPDRTGKYTYSFSITNFSEEDLSYELETEMFTQYMYIQGDEKYLFPDTDYLDATVTYTYENTELQHDVDKDGDTDTDDAQALLDYITGVVDGKDLDLEAGEMDGNEGISTYDAKLLLDFIENYEVPEELTVLAGETKTITVEIQLEDLADLNEIYEAGLYVEGYTYVTCISETEDGEILDVEKSIPMIGFYGSWTDPSMYDVTVVEQLYEGKEPYAGTGKTNNYMSIVYPGETSSSVVIGNPYAIEDEFPADKLAMSSETTIKAVKYALIRNAGTAGALAYKVNDDGSAGKTLYKSDVSTNVYAQYYYTNGGAWQNISGYTAKINKKVSEFGLSEGDKFNVGVFAAPEYYAMDSLGVLTADQLEALVKDGTLGAGAELGYTFTVDNTAPVIEKVELSEDGNTITVTASDNAYIAYIALMDIGATVVYDGTVPEMEEGGSVTVTFDVSNIDIGNAAAVMVGDYAANETYKLAVLADGPVTVKKPVYMLTDTIVDGTDYVIASTNTAGTTNVLMSNGVGYFCGNSTQTVITDENGTYIMANTVADENVWTAAAATGGFTFTNASFGSYLSALGSGYKAANYSIATVCSYADDYFSTDTNYLFYYPANGSWLIYSSPFYNTYIYGLTYIEEEVDITVATKVEVTPSVSTLILGVDESTQLTAKVYPAYLDDTSVTWTSSDTSVATVDANGVVTPVSVGSVTITATSNQTNTVSGTAIVEVVKSNPMDATVNGMIQVGSKTYFAEIDLSDMSYSVLGDGANDDYPIVGGGRDGNYITGADVDGDIYKYDVTNSYSFEYKDTMAAAYVPLDGANFPKISNADTTFDCDLVGVTASDKLGFYDMDAMSLSSFNTSSYHSHGVAVTYTGYGTTSSGYTANYYYILTADGELWVWGIYNKSATSLSGTLGQIGTVTGLTIKDDANYSMTYAMSATGEDALFIADDSIGAIYYVEIPESDDLVEMKASLVGTLDGVAYVGTLYEDVFDAVDDLTVSARIKAIADGGVEVDAVVESFGTKPVETTSETPEIEEAPVVEIEEAPVVETEENEEATGSLNVVSTNTIRAKRMVTRGILAQAVIETDTDDENGTATVVYKEDVAATNGVVTVEYDTESLTFVDVTTDVEFTSVKDEDGTITFAYAQTEEIAAGSVIATFNFEAKCEDATVTVTVEELNDTLEAADPIEETVEGIGHDYQFVEFQWNKDNTAAKALFVCANDESHTLLVDAEVTEEIVEEATTEKAGKKIVKATVTYNDETYEEEKEVVIPMIANTGDFAQFTTAVTVMGVSFIALIVAIILKKKATSKLN